MPMQVMLVTGASKGMGLQTVLHALHAGFRVAATSRDAQKLRESVQNGLGVEADFAIEHFLPLEMAFDQSSIQAAVQCVHDTWGAIDVLVNNAGYAVLGAFEEFSLEEVQQNFAVNVFGVMQVTQAVLPIMRAQKSGRIINMASISGTVSGPGQSIYSATKAAVIQMSEALALEVAPFGIQVCAVCPGGVRTDFLDARSMRRPAKSLPEYEVVYQTMEGLNRLNHNQSGDPELVAEALIQLTRLAEIPQRLYLGSGAVAGLEHKLNAIATEAADYIELSRSIDNPLS